MSKEEIENAKNEAFLARTRRKSSKRDIKFAWNPAAGPATKESRKTWGVEVGASMAKNAGSSVPGTGLLKRATAAYSKWKGKLNVAQGGGLLVPLGKGMARDYYGRIPRELGFKPVKDTVYLSEFKKDVRVSKYDPNAVA